MLHAKNNNPLQSRRGLDYRIKAANWARTQIHPRLLSENRNLRPITKAGKSKKKFIFFSKLKKQYSFCKIIFMKP